MGLDRGSVVIDNVRLDHTAFTRQVLKVLLPLFFLSVVLLGFRIGDPLVVENLAAALILATALCGFVHLFRWFETSPYTSRGVNNGWR